MIHKLLEDAASGRFNSEPTDTRAIARRWDALVAAEESIIKKSWLERHFSPLREAIGAFDERRLQTLARAGELAAIAKHSDGAEPAADGPLYGTEIWVQTNGKEVGGFIDDVHPSAEGPVIRDYKSGALTGQGGAVKPEYAAQLKLYAALYATDRNIWPDKLELMPLSGDAIEIPFSRQECDALLGRAITIRAEINSVIAQETSTLDLHQALASPDPENCRFCSYRPSCHAYHEVKPASNEGDWPGDRWGTFVGEKQLGNGTLLIRIESAEGLIRVRDLTSNKLRNPALQELCEGRWTEVFSAWQAGERSFRQTSFTIVYVRPADDG